MSMSAICMMSLKFRDCKSGANRQGNNGNSVRLCLGSKITVDGDCSHEIKIRLLLGRKVITNLVKQLGVPALGSPRRVRLLG